MRARRRARMSSRSPLGPKYRGLGAAQVLGELLRMQTEPIVILAAVGKELRPGNGSICAALEVASGQKPLFIGKPEAIIVNRALDLAGVRAEEALIVGDNYPTDIMAGINSGVDTLLTLTGVTQKADLAGLTPPTYLVNDLDEFSL